MLVKGNCRIVGVGEYFPSQVIESDDLMEEAHCTRHGIPINFISRHIGILQRRWSDELGPYQLALNAARYALQDSGMSPEDLDMIIYCGIEGEYQEPSTAHLIQRDLGCIRSICFDMSNACLGLMTGIATANAYIGCGGAENVLVCTGEKGSTIIAETLRKISKVGSRADFNTLVGGLTVGDAGGAFVLTKKTDHRGFTWFNTISRGEMAELCWYRHTPDGLDGYMDIGNVAARAIEAHAEIIDDSYQAMDWKPEEVDSLTAHQVGRRVHRQHASVAKVSVELAANTHRHLGNIASATWAPAFIANRPQSGHKMFMMSSASGISVGQTGHLF